MSPVVGFEKQDPSDWHCCPPSGHRFEDVPGVRRHLVRKSAKAQMVHVSKGHKEPSTRQRKQDRQPHEVRGPGAGDGQG